ncbi:MAG: PAS domain S-box protein [Alphaproteobacteria bacterium]|nr:PAS domain S-box protein [Alphaproteobacteria bacterium]MBV9371679.1 PAS domain S-box protein [Alphaproteobacteria bacterium]MBV9902455.1 PAS domain S-box protein [Alphaproteobacteria bacterium]
MPEPAAPLPNATDEGALGAALAALRASEERLRIAQAAGGVGTFEFVPETATMLVSPEFCRIWGVPVVEAAPIEAFMALIHPEDRRRVEAAHEISDEDGLEPLEYRIRRPDTQEVRWLARRGEAVRDPATGRVSWYGAVWDVTGRKAAEEALREREGLLSAFIDQATAGFAQVDLSGVFTLVNDRFCEIAGRSREELLGLRMQDITHEEDLPRNVPMFERAVRDGTPYVHEKRYIRGDGSLVWVNNSVSVIRRPTGEPYGILAITIDVTERRKAEAAVRENEARLRALTDNLPAGMVYQIGTGRDGEERRFLFVSQSCRKLTGYPAEALVADSAIAYEMILEEDRPGLAAAEAKALRERGAFDAQARFRRADGEIRWARIISAPREAPDGGLIWDGIKIDITDQKRAEEVLLDLAEALERRVAERAEELARAQEALRQSQKMEAMGQLTGGVAHDFNNLLTPIIGSLDLLARKGSGGAREQRLVEGALQSAERAKTLVQRLLAFARRQPLQAGPVDVAELVAEMVDLVASTIGPDIRIETAVPAGLPFARADANQLEMAILNLAVNARDAMPSGGTIAVSAAVEDLGAAHPSGASPGRYMRLSVGDTGVGMDAQTLARAVEPFFSTKGVGRGTGLGLSMVHGLAAQLGGGLAIESEPGIGTTVSLWLPLSDERPGAARAEAGAANAIAGAGRVLLVDDEPLVRASAADMLTELGYEVEEAESAEAALERIEAAAPDIVITDHLMPGLSGTDLAALLRRTRPGLPVLIVSGYADLEGLPAALPRLTKPFRQSDLAACVGRLLRVGDTICDN